MISFRSSTSSSWTSTRPQGSMLPIEIPGHVRAGVVYDGTRRGALKEYQRSRAPGGKCFTIGIGPLAIEKYEGGMLPPAVIRARLS